MVERDWLTALPVKLFALLIENPVLQEMERFGRMDLDLAAQFFSPFFLLRVESFFQVSSNERVEINLDLRKLALFDEHGELIFNQFREEDGRLYLATSGAGGTVFSCLDMHFGPDPLTGDLHQAKLTQRKDVVLGFINRHHLLHPVVQLLLVVVLVHINEVHHDNPAHISQA